MVTVWSPARLRAYCRALRTRCAVNRRRRALRRRARRGAVPTSGEVPNRTAHSAVDGYRSSPVAVTSTGTARNGPTARTSRPLSARSTTAGGTTTSPTSVAVTDGVIPVPIVESSHQNAVTDPGPHTGRPGCREHRQHGRDERPGEQHGQAEQVARPDLHASRREPHGPVDQAAGESRDDVGGDGGVQVPAGAPPQVVRRAPRGRGRCAMSSTHHRCRADTVVRAARAPTGTGATGTRRRPAAHRAADGAAVTPRAPAGTAPRSRRPWRSVAASSRPSGSGGCGAIARRTLLRCRPTQTSVREVERRAAPR